MEIDDVIALLRALNDCGVRYAVVGGVAINLHGLARATADIDLFVSPDEANVGRLRTALHAVFDDAHIEEITANDLAGDYPAIQYVPPHGAFHIDILARLGEAFSFADIETEKVAFEGVNVNVATPRMLIRMKRDTVRLQDKADAQKLREKFKIEDE